MRARRLIFVRTPRPMSLAPVYLAFMVVAVVAALGFALAYWPRERAYSDYRPVRPVREEAAASSGTHDGGVLAPTRARDLPGRTRRM